jgi:hypothetical protein
MTTTTTMTSLLLLLLLVLIAAATASERVKRPFVFGRMTFHTLIHAAPQTSFSHSTVHSITGLAGLDHESTAVQEVVKKSSQPETPGEFHFCATV